MVNKVALSVLVIFLLSPSIITLETSPVPEKATRLNRVIARYDEFVEQTLQEYGVPGAAIAIVDHGEVVYLKGFGVRELGRPEMITPHTVFRIASLSKGFAAVLTGLLVQDGILNWDDRVTKYLPDFSLRDLHHAHALTIRHILSHTSGLPAHAYDNLLDARVPFDAIVEQLKNAPILFPAGKLYAYQNVVYSLIGPVIESATGKEYPNLLRKRLFIPLAMHDASLSYEELLADTNRATPHIRRRHRWMPMGIKNTYYSVLPAAGINASIFDMAQWLRALLGGMPAIVPPEIVQQITEPLIRTPREKRRLNWNGHVRDAYYGLGWRILDYEGMKLIFHSGGVRGYRAQIAFIPEEKVGIVVLLNAEVANHFASAFFDMYLGGIE
ncbi:MAG: beta-lactamase family protein [candidate division KSB1 bacterium]|nr:beta-lactamase family protein [candidate division KSB1 bacterium]MDZ7312597.1 beta-lactamase family protein [candidate division KSB1 bacterium]